jgi:hypothetical protein
MAPRLNIGEVLGGQRARGTRKMLCFAGCKVGRKALAPTNSDAIGKRDRRNQYMGLGNLGGLGNLDLGQLQQLLPNVNFPASKDEVLSDLQSNNAPQEVVDQVRNSGKDTFNSADEVLHTVQQGGQ